MPDYTDIRSIRNFKSLVKYLRKHLDWPIDEEQADDLTYGCTPAELGRVLFTQDKGVIESATNQRIRWPYPLASPGLPSTDKTAAIR